MATLTLVIGGVRSGKSRLAEHLAAASPPVTYIATAFAGDAEMARRIARHQQRRPAEWKTVEEPWEVVRAVSIHASGGSVLLECLPLWLTNLLVGLSGKPAKAEADILAEVDALIEAAGRPVEDRGSTIEDSGKPSESSIFDPRSSILGSPSGRLIVVSNEVGCGVMPANELARRFGDLLGEANQRLAARAAEVYGCVAGISYRLK
jgi:adenosylcobinamide kinase/adenosylcobinamide-phosphate guanylyltransferase